MAKRKTKRQSSSRKKASRRRSAPRVSRPSRKQEDKTGMWVALVLAVVAVVGLVLLYSNAQPAGNAVVKGIQTYSPGGLLEGGQIGYDLGDDVAARWDGSSELVRYCSVTCGNVCGSQTKGSDQAECQRTCSNKCEESAWQ